MSRPGSVLVERVRSINPGLWVLVKGEIASGKDLVILSTLFYRQWESPTQEGRHELRVVLAVFQQGQSWLCEWSVIRWQSVW
jgi:hypothetical protein